MNKECFICGEIYGGKLEDRTNYCTVCHELGNIAFQIFCRENKIAEALRREKLLLA